MDGDKNALGIDYCPQTRTDRIPDRLGEVMGEFPQVTGVTGVTLALALALRVTERVLRHGTV